MTGTDRPDRARAIAAIQRLMEEHGIDPSELRRDAVAPAHVEPAPASSRRRALGPIVLRVFYYLGGTLVFTGLGIYIETVWHELTSFQRVLITFGPGFIAFVLGILFARNPDLEKAATPAHLVAFVMQPVGVGVFLNEYFEGDNPALGAMVIFGPLALQQLLAFLALKRQSLLLFALLFAYAFLGAATIHYDFDRGVAALASGMFLYFIGVDVQARKAYRDISPVCFVLGAGLMMAGLYYHAGRTIYDPLILALSLAFLMHAVIIETRTLFVLAVLYVIAYTWGGINESFSMLLRRHYHEATAVVAGTSLVLTGQWLTRSKFTSASPIWFFAGTSFALGGVYSALHNTIVEPLFAGIATLAIYAALAVRSRAMLASAILALIIYIIAYAQRHFADSVSWPLLVILFGFMVLAAGWVFARLSVRMRLNTEPRT
jgi:hypothetical protein